MEATTGTQVDAELVAAVTAESLGNPLHVCELVRLLQTTQPDAEKLTLQGDLPLPPTIREIMLRRVARLSTGCQELLGLCALTDRTMSFWLLHRASGLEREELLTLLQEAIDAQLLVEELGPGRYRFTHPLVQETLASQLSQLRRLKLHARLGEALLELSEREMETHLAELAHHLYEATPLGYAEEATIWNLRAGRQALRQLAFGQAAVNFQRGLEALSLQDESEPRLQAELLVELGEARAAAFDPAAREIYREAAGLARSAGAPDLLARAALGFEGRMMGPHAVDPERASLLEDALALLPPGDSVLRVRLMSILAKGLGELVRAVAPLDDPFSRRRRTTLCDEAVSMAHRLNDRHLLAHALQARWYALHSPDNLEQRLYDCDAAMSVGAGASDPVLRWNSHMYSVFQLLEVEQIEGAFDHMDHCIEIAEQFRVPFFIAVAASFRALRELWRGSIQEAGELIDSPWRDDQDWLGLAMRSMFSFSRALLSGNRNDLSLLEAPIRSLIPPDPLGWAWRTRLTLLLAKLGRAEEARDLFDELGSCDFQDLPREQGFVLFAAHLAEAAKILNDRDRAAALYGLLLPYEKRSVSAFQFFDGPVPHYLGLLSTTLQEWDQADKHLADAIARCRRMQTPPYEVRSRVARAGVLLRRGRPGDRGEARRELDCALPRAKAMGMVGYAEQARRLAQAAAEGRGLAKPPGRSGELTSEASF
jgi:hypothetical protein